MIHETSINTVCFSKRICKLKASTQAFTLLSSLFITYSISCVYFLHGSVGGLQTYSSNFNVIRISQQCIGDLMKMQFLFKNSGISNKALAYGKERIYE